jgi:hypothetical protein
MPFQSYGLFLPACFAINMALGPNNVLSISNGARNGMHCAIVAAFGRLLAFAMMIAIAGLGLGALLLASQTLFTILKFGGAAYLVWIGIKLVRSGPALLTRAPEDAGLERASWRIDPGFTRVSMVQPRERPDHDRLRPAACVRATSGDVSARTRRCARSFFEGIVCPMTLSVTAARPARYRWEAW